MNKTVLRDFGKNKLKMDVYSFGFGITYIPIGQNKIKQLDQATIHFLSTVNIFSKKNVGYNNMDVLKNRLYMCTRVQSGSIPKIVCILSIKSAYLMFKIVILFGTPTL